MDVAEVQRIALLFDYILVWSVDRQKRSTEDLNRLNQEIDFLREMDVVRTCGPSFPFVARTKEGGRHLFSQDLDVPIPYVLMNRYLTIEDHAPDYASSADRVVHKISHAISYMGAPVAAHVAPSRLVASNGGDIPALRVVLSQIPFPAGDMPWQDFVQFRKEQESIAKLRALRLWIQKLGNSTHSVHEMEEELLHLLEDYNAYMRLQRIKVSRGSLSTVVSSVAEAVGHTMLLNLGGAVKSLLDIRTQSIELKLAEFSAPGREVSYIAHAQNFLGNR